MPIPLEDAQTMLAAYIEAEKQILLGKEVRIGGANAGADRWHRMEDLPAVRAGRIEWQSKVDALQRAAAPQRAPTIGGLGYCVADFSAHT